MPNKRETHKTALQTILQTITYKTQLLEVETYYTTNPDKYPYLYIVSGEFRRSPLDNRNDDNFWTYHLVVFFNQQTPGSSSETLEADIDELEALILDKITSMASRGNEAWDDITLTQVSGAFRPEPNITEGLIAKEFTLVVRDADSLN